MPKISPAQMLTAIVLIVVALIAAYATITAARVSAAATITAAQVTADAQHRAMQEATPASSQVGAVGEEGVENQVSPRPPVGN
jgi:type II secretory pathway pseudopilin PulG